MASTPSTNSTRPSLNQITPTHSTLEINEPVPPPDNSDPSSRSQWLRAAVLGANDGLLSIASLMMGVGGVFTDVKTMRLFGLAGLFAGACSMATGELVSVYSQYDIELAHLHRQNLSPQDLRHRKSALPGPYKAACASFFAFSAGAIVPLLAGGFISAYKTRIAVVVATLSISLFAFGWLGAVLGGARPFWASVRILIGGWVCMGVTFAVTKAAGDLTGF